MYRVEYLEGRTLFASYSAATTAELIAAINHANHSAQADTITLATGAAFSLTASDNTAEPDGPNGLPVITAGGGALTVVGNGATIERGAAAQTAFRLFAVAAGGSLALRDLTLQNGLGVAQQNLALVPHQWHPGLGGGILSWGALSLDHVTLQNNRAQGEPGHVNWGIVFGASDGAGGGIYSSGALRVTDSVIRNNFAWGGPGGAGVGARGLGGGIFIAGGTAVVERTAITGNTAQGGWASPTGANGYGGGLYATGGSLSVRSSTINSNAALGGDGFRLRRGTSVSGNAGDGIGGGIYIETAASVGLDSFTVGNMKGNKASAGGRNIFGDYTKIV